MLMQLLNRVRREVGLCLRLTRPYVEGILDKRGESILDVGCGKGESIIHIDKHRRFFRVGVDIFEPYLKESQRQGTYDGVALCDIRMLPFERKTFDIVMCMDVLEHLTKQDGRNFIAQLEQIARRQVIIESPAGTCIQQPLEGNLYMEHKSTWTATELISLGYKVRGFGVQGLYGEQGLRFRLPRIISIPFCSIIFVLSSPFTFFVPKVAGDMVCIKKL
jgi:SAM-dependent methyltransferase